MNQDQPSVPTPQATPPINSQQQSNQTSPNLTQNNNKTLNTVIAIILLLFVFPAGLIYMWLATSWSKGFKWFLTLFFPVLFGLGLGLMFINNARHPLPQAPSKYLSTDTIKNYIPYSSPNLGITFQYPEGWQVYDNQTQVRISNCDTASRDFCLNNQGGDQASIIISKSGGKDTGTTLSDYLTTKEPSFKNAKLETTKTTNGYEMLKVISFTGDYYITDGRVVFRITREGMSTVGQNFQQVIDKITNSIKITSQ